MRPSMLLRSPVWAVFLTAVLAAPPGHPTDSPPMDSARPMGASKVELHRLKNDDLLKQAGDIHDRANQDYLASARGLAAVELLLEEAVHRTDAATEPGSRPLDSTGKVPLAEEKAQAVVDAAKASLETAKRRLGLTQSRKDLLGRASAARDVCQSSAGVFLNALDDLKPYLVEIGLRVKDGTLTADKVPDALSRETLERRRKRLRDDQLNYKQQTTDAQKQQAALARQLEEANKAVLAAEADVAQAGKALAQEQKRREMEKAHAGKSPDEMLTDLTRLVEEGAGLKGTYELALSRFNVQAGEVATLRKALDALKQPTVKIPQISRAEDVEVAARSIQELIQFYSGRTKAIEALRVGLVALVKQGGEFEADAAVSYEHLFRMKVLASLLGKAGVTEDRFPAGGQSKRLADAADRQTASAAEVQAATEKGKSELAALEKQLDEARQAGDGAAKQLANLKSSQPVTTAVLKYEEQLRTMTADQVIEAFIKNRQDLTALLEKLAADKDGGKTAALTVTEARARLEGLKDPLLRNAEEQGQAEHLKILGELRKEAGLERAGMPPMTTSPPAEPRKPEGDSKPDKAGKAEPDRRTEMEKTTETLIGLQQLLAAQARVLNEREERTRELLAALEELEKKSKAHNDNLSEARRLALQLAAAASDLKKRVGMGELPGDKVPDGATDALRVEFRDRLNADAAGVLTTLAHIEQEREKLRLPNPEREAFRTASRELLALVGQRLDLLADLKKLAADYRREKKDRPPSEVKRLDQLAADRQSDDNRFADRLLGIDSSRAAKTLEELLEAYYQELIEIEDRDGNLKKQKEAIDQLVELTRKESVAVANTLPLLTKQVAQLQAAQEQELVLTRARLRPEQADELLKAHQAKTGQLLSRPAPLLDTEKAEKVTEMAGVLFRRLAQLEAARKWEEVLTARIAPTGLKVEAGVYQDELARVNSTAGANARRVAALTGQERVEPGKALSSEAAQPSVLGGEIGKTRQELTQVRIEGVKGIGIKIAIILLIAYLLPRMLLWLIRRAVGGEDTGLVLAALRMFLKAGVWVTAFALILWVLGFDVTAILAGLGIGGLAIGLAAQPMLSDVIAALVIFVERKFKIGDVIRMGTGEPVRVIGLSWRSTQLRNADGLVVNVPNRMVTEQAIQNLTRTGQTYDSLDVTVTTQQEVSKVLGVIRLALEECKYLATDHGVSVKEFSHKGDTKVGRYRFWWFVTDYEGRNRTRDEVFTRISGGLAEEDLKGTEVTLT